MNYFECRSCGEVCEMVAGYRRCRYCSSTDLVSIGSDEYKAALLASGKIVVICGEPGKLTDN